MNYPIPISNPYPHPTMKIEIATNELEETYKKVFEGIGFCPGDAEDLALGISWLEMHSLSIIGQIQRSIDNQTLPNSCSSEILSQDETSAVVDAAQNGAVIYGGLAVDIAYLNALHKGSFSMHIKNGWHPYLLFPSVVTCGQRGMNLIVDWFENGLYHLITMSAGADCPHYEIYQAENGVISPSSLGISLLCASELGPIRDATKRLKQHKQIFSMTSRDFKHSYQHHLEQGLEIDSGIWAELAKLSEACLVELDQA